jgi:hypothetical protein
MKKLQACKSSGMLLLTVFLLISGSYASSQQKENTSQPIPGDLQKIFTNSCTPCHTSKGSLLPRFKLNFDVWSESSAEKQKSKAKEIYSMVSKDKMPPKSARENRPDIVLTKEQIDLVKKWSESLALVK